MFFDRPIDGLRKASILYAINQQVYVDFNDAAIEGTFVTDYAEKNLVNSVWRRWNWYPGYYFFYIPVNNSLIIIRLIRQPGGGVTNNCANNLGFYSESNGTYSLLNDVFCTWAGKAICELRKF